MITSRHTLSHCELCKTDMVICADCGNNCCNALTGEIDGKRCGCKEAYAHQAAYWEDAFSVIFAKDSRNAS